MLCCIRQESWAQLSSTDEGAGEGELWRVSQSKYTEMSYFSEHILSAHGRVDVVVQVNVLQLK